MIGDVVTSVHHLARGAVSDDVVMSWGCPVPYFGRAGNATVATLGINPSNREFVDDAGNELDGPDRRFPTLRSLGIRSWSNASSLDLAAVLMACDRYFDGNPYNRWFKVLDAAIVRTGASFYSVAAPAAHLDLVPFATNEKWADVPVPVRRELLRTGRDLLAGVLRDAPIQLLILNGRSVVREFERVCEISLPQERQPSWDLGPRDVPRVLGYSYSGEVYRIGGVDLGRRVHVVGFNHNLQSSFGVTTAAIAAIAAWIGSMRQ